LTRMFTIRGQRMKTWNVFKGCKFDCTYCSARRLALTRLSHLPQYADGFYPRLVEQALGKSFQEGDFVFIGYMGDIAWAYKGELETIMARVATFPLTTFLMLTKAPSVYLEWQEAWGFKPPPNLYLGTTIESNYDHKVSKAPPPEKRYQAMVQLDHPRKFVSIEPLMDFHLATLVTWMKDIKPDIIEIGLDNYGNNLPEPKSAITGGRSPWKVKTLVQMLRTFCPDVVEKPGLTRLLYNNSEGGEKCQNPN